MNYILRSRPVFMFRVLSEDGVLAALDDPNAGNPVAAEVTRLVALYADTFQQRPSDILSFKPRWPIEKVALGLAANYF